MAVIFTGLILLEGPSTRNAGKHAVSQRWFRPKFTIHGALVWKFISRVAVYGLLAFTAFTQTSADSAPVSGRYP